MEADEYFSTYDALYDEESGIPAGRLEIRLKDPCGINKIVWSSFDFISGPELKFVWEITSSTSTSPVNLSGEESSLNDAESLDSTSAHSEQYEDIDDPLQTDLTSTTQLIDGALMGRSVFDIYSCSTSRDAFFEDVRCFGGYMTDSRSTITGASTVVAGEESKMVNTVDMLPNDLMCGTPLESMNLSELLTSDQNDEQRKWSKCDTSATDSGSSTTAGKTNNSSFTRLSDPEFINTFEKSIAPKVLDSKKIGDDGLVALTTSCVDSGIAGTISTHSDLSAFCQSPITESSSLHPKYTREYPHFAEERPIQSQRSSPDSLSDIMTSFLDISLEPSDESNTDEQFVYKFVLAEQICSTQMPSIPLIHKMTIINTRRLLVGSFIFTADTKDDRKTIQAISFLMNHKRSNWYMLRESFLETLIMDIVPRVKASMIAEAWDDVLVRATSEFSQMMALITVLDRYTLISPLRPVMIKNSLLSEKRCQDNRLLGKVISGILQSQGHCVVIGSDHSYVSRLLRTLIIFVPEELRWCCMRTYRYKFNPFLRLQAVRRSELQQVVQCGAQAVWPICIADLDRSTVYMSAPYSRHRVLRSRTEMQKIRDILGSHHGNESAQVTLELSSCRVLDCVKTFLRRLDLLPMEESARMGLTNQFLLYIENMGHALIAYVKDASLPSSSEKESATKSSHFSLNECRKALDLQSDSWFHAVLARADLIQPDLAEFIYGC